MNAMRLNNAQMFNSAKMQSEPKCICALRHVEKFLGHRIVDVHSASKEQDLSHVDIIVQTSDGSEYQIDVKDVMPAHRGDGTYCLSEHEVDVLRNSPAKLKMHFIAAVEYSQEYAEDWSRHPTGKFLLFRTADVLEKLEKKETMYVFSVRTLEPSMHI